MRYDKRQCDASFVISLRSSRLCRSCCASRRLSSGRGATNIPSFFSTIGSRPGSRCRFDRFIANRITARFASRQIARSRRHAARPTVGIPNPGGSARFNSPDPHPSAGRGMDLRCARCTRRVRTCRSALWFIRSASRIGSPRFCSPHFRQCGFISSVLPGGALGASVPDCVPPADMTFAKAPSVVPNVGRRTRAVRARVWRRRILPCP